MPIDEARPAEMEPIGTQYGQANAQTSAIDLLDLSIDCLVAKPDERYRGPETQFEEIANSRQIFSKIAISGKSENGHP